MPRLRIAAVVAVVAVAVVAVAVPAVRTSSSSCSSSNSSSSSSSSSTSGSSISTSSGNPDPILCEGSASCKNAMHYLCSACSRVLCGSCVIKHQGKEECQLFSWVQLHEAWLAMKQRVATPAKNIVSCLH